jgi:type I restriction enzyme, S subunit
LKTIEKAATKSRAKAKHADSPSTKPVCPELVEVLSTTLGEFLPLAYGKAKSLSYGFPQSDTNVFGSSGVIGSFEKALTNGPTLIVGRKGSAGAVLYSKEPCWPIDTVFYTVGHSQAFLLFFRYLFESLQLSQLDRSTAIPSLSRDDYNSIKVSVPPVPTQHRIVAEIEEKLSRLDAAQSALLRAQANLKRYRASIFAQACTGDFPIHPFGDICQIQGGIQKQPKRAPVANHFPFLRVANVLRGRLKLEDVHRVELFGVELNRLRLETGDLLIVEGNGSPAEIGRMAIWRNEIADCVHQNHIIRARPSAKILPDYAAIYWNSPLGQDAVQKVASSSSGLYTLSVRKLAAIAIPLPSIKEQQKIVEDVDRRHSVIDSTEQTLRTQLERAKRLRQSILQQAFKPG